MFKMTAAILVLLSWINPAFAEPRKFQSWEDACVAVAANVTEGDLIFLDIPSIVFRKVAEGTMSWTSHVGVVFKDKDGAWIVAESTIPRSQEVPLCAYLKNSSEYTFEIKRLNRPLSEIEIAKMHSTATSLLNKFYTLGFDFDSPRLYCSKFAYLTYQSIGVEAGKIQTFRQLLEENPGASITFWKFWFLGFIPWEQRTVTPASQLNDPKFVSILKGA